MIALSFERWNSSAGRWFVCERIYRNGRWTPLVRVSKRYTYARLYGQLAELRATVAELESRVSGP